MSSAERVSKKLRPLFSVAEIRDGALFRGVEMEDLWHLLEACSVCELDPGEELIGIGETDGRLYIVLDGILSVYVGSHEDEAIAILRAGDSVGEISALDRKPRSAAVVTQERARVLALEESDFWALMNRSHQFALNLLEVLSQRLRGNNATIVDSRKLQEQYRRHASTDPLTGLLNRRGLDELGTRLMRRLAMKNEPMSLLMIDVDHFKKFNDTYGHQAGDFVLFAVAQVLKAGLRPTDVVARYGGEEFIVLLPDTPLEGARVAAERVRQAIANTDLAMPDGLQLPAVTASMGAAVLSPDLTLEQLVQQADAALYEAKRAGRNCVMVAE